MPRKRLGEILIEAHLIDDEKLRQGLAEQRKWGGQLGRVMVDRGIITEEALVRALSQQLRIPIIDLSKTVVPKAALDVVSVDLAQQHNVLPTKLDGKFLDLAMSDPTNVGVVDEIRMRTTLDVQPFLAGPRAIEQAIRHWYGLASPGRMSMTSMAVVPHAGAGPVESSASRALSEAERDQEIRSLQKRVQMLEGLLQRDEDVIRQLCLIMIESKLVTREEILKRLGK